MTNKKHLGVIRGSVILGAAFVLAIIGTLTGLLWSPSLTKAGATLPARDETHPDDDHNSDNDLVGAYILLQTESVPASAWSVVQWLGADGNWHDVDGWQGPVPANNQWWVAAKDFNTGPFRWAIKSDPGGEVIGASESFMLPQFPNETLIVSVSLSN